MSGATSPQRGLTRRSFLKTTAAVTGAVAAMGTLTSIPAFANGENNTASYKEEVKQGVCRGTCMGGCLFNWTVRDGHVVKSEAKLYPDEDYSRICSKGLSHAQRAYSPQRIKYPMRRVEGSERGSGEFEQITWDEAIDEITTKWKGYIKEFGPASIVREKSSGIGQAQVGQYLSTMAEMLGFSTSTHLSDQAGGYMPRTVIGGGPYYNFGNEPADIANAKHVFLLGSNGAVTQLHCSTFLNEMKDKGGTVVAIDPNYGPTTAGWGDIFVPIRVGTDACLFMGMMHVVIDEGLADEDFLRSMTTAPLLVKKTDGMFLRQEHLDGVEPKDVDSQVDTVIVCDEDGSFRPLSEAVAPVLHGTYEVDGFEATTAYDLILKRLDEYPLDMCSQLCDIPEDEIKRLARMFADGPTTVVFQFGPDKYYNGHLAYFAGTMMSTLRGNLFKRGASFMQPNILATTLATSKNWTSLKKESESLAALKASYPGKSKSYTFSIQRLAEAVKSGTVDGKPIGDGTLELKSWYIAGHNSILGTVNHARAVEAANAFEFIVVQDMFWNDSANYADIVLPVCYFTEYEEVVTPYGFSAPYVTLSEKCADPAFESKSDYEIVNLLLEGLGVGDIAAQSMDEWFNFSFDNSSDMKKLGMTWDAFREAGIVRPPSSVGVDGEACISPCVTSYKRVNLYLENPKSTDPFPREFDVEKERMVHWEPPAEAWTEDICGYPASEISKTYPLTFHQKRSRYSTHSSFGLGSHWLDELDPEPFIRLNPRDAAARNISDGDIVRIYNDRGYCVIKAFLDAGLRPGCVDSTHRYDGSRFIEGCLADLPNPDLSNPYVYNSCYYDCQVEVALYEEA